MAKKRKETPRRFRDIPGHASIDAAEKSIAETMGLPAGSIKIVLPNGRKARSDSTLASLREKHKK